MLTLLGAVCICAMLGAVTVTDTRKELTDLYFTAITGLQQTLVFLINEIWCFTCIS